MDLDLRLSVLEQIYTLYDDFLSHRQVACEKQCAHCCTGHMGLTTLEGYAIVRRMPAAARRCLAEKLHRASGNPRFRPQLTINELAALCAKGRQIPEETLPPNSGTCPMLSDDLCPIYAMRPFACRCMVSRTRCTAGGSADMPSLILSLNNVVLQYIEHVDLQGYTGNFSDVMRFLTADGDSAADARYPATPPGPESGLIANHPLTVLMIPPEHRNEIRPIMDRLQCIRPRNTGHVVLKPEDGDAEPSKRL